MKTAFQEIQEINKWWLSLRPDFNGLNHMLYNAQRLSGFLLNLGDDLATARNAWAASKALYEKEVKQLKMKFEKTTSSTQAETQARANTAKLYEMEARAEGIYFGMKHQYDAVVEVLETMRQRIAVLRREWEMKNYAG